MNYLTIPELIEVLQQIDKRKYRNTPYLSDIVYPWDKNVLTLTFVAHPNGGSTKHIRVSLENGEVKCL